MSRLHHRQEGSRIYKQKLLGGILKAILVLCLSFSCCSKSEYDGWSSSSLLGTMREVPRESERCPDILKTLNQTLIVRNINLSLLTPLRLVPVNTSQKQFLTNTVSVSLLLFNFPLFE